MKKEITIGTRGSYLALAQTNYIKIALENKFPNIKFNIKEIITTGDVDLTSSWTNNDVSLKSFFTKEIETELLEGKIDIAVHSMKDMPLVSPKGLICGAIPEREDARDALVSNEKYTLMTLPPNSVVGTSSYRRAMSIKNLRDDLIIKDIRGNILTRIKKLKEKEYDAIILAVAGLKRSGLEEEITEYLDPNLFLPAPAQGALYIQCREDNDFIKSILSTINDKKVEKIVEIEREFSRIFDGGCHTPMGCYSEVTYSELDGNKIKFKGVYFHNEIPYVNEIVENIELGKEIANRLASKIKENIKDE